MSRDTSGTIVEWDERDTGDYTFKQLNVRDVETENMTEDDNDNWKFEGKSPINWRFGPIELEAYIDTSTLDIEVWYTILGIRLPVVKGNLKDGTRARIDLHCVKGTIRQYLKNGNEVWVHLDLKVTFDGSFDKDVKLMMI